MTPSQETLLQASHHHSTSPLKPRGPTNPLKMYLFGYTIADPLATI
jgi:hypothetical protein